MSTRAHNAAGGRRDRMQRAVCIAFSCAMHLSVIALAAQLSGPFHARRDTDRAGPVTPTVTLRLLPSEPHEPALRHDLPVPRRPVRSATQERLQSRSAGAPTPPPPPRIAASDLPPARAAPPPLRARMTASPRPQPATPADAADSQAQADPPASPPSQAPSQPVANPPSATSPRPAAKPDVPNEAQAIITSPDTPIAFKKLVHPRQSALSRRLGESGVVRVLITVDAKGVLTGYALLPPPAQTPAPPQRLCDAAIEALLASTFIPALHDGRPVRSRRVVEYRF